MEETNDTSVEIEIFSTTYRFIICSSYSIMVYGSLVLYLLITVTRWKYRTVFTQSFYTIVDYVTLLDALYLALFGFLFIPTGFLDSFYIGLLKFTKPKPKFWLLYRTVTLNFLGESITNLLANFDTIWFTAITFIHIPLSLNRFFSIAPYLKPWLINFFENELFKRMNFYFFFQFQAEYKMVSNPFHQ